MVIKNKWNVEDKQRQRYIQTYIRTSQQKKKL